LLIDGFSDSAIATRLAIKEWNLYCIRTSRQASAGGGTLGSPKNNTSGGTPFKNGSSNAENLTGHDVDEKLG
jgi:hypothetical protein